MIKLDNIHIAYDKVLFDHESINVPSSCITLIKGESGSGKSALLYRLGLLTNDCDIYIDDVLINNPKLMNDIRRNRIGFVFQNNEIIDHLDVKQNLKHYAFMVGKDVNNKDLLEILEIVQLHVPLHQSVSTLSLGQKQRLAIGCALIKEPDIFILDEPTASLDKENEMIIFHICHQLAHQMHKSVIISSHSETASMVADRIYTIENQHLILTKDQAIQDNTIIKQHTKISPQFYQTYCHDTFKKYKVKYGLLSIIILSIIVLSIFSICFTNQLLESNKTLIYDQYDKLLYVTKNKETRFPYNSYDLYDYGTFESYEHPYIKITLTEDTQVNIIPYFDSQDLSNKLDSYNHISNYENGIYLSHEAYESIRMNYPSITDNMSLNFEIYEDNNNINKSVDITILGTLKNGIYDTYNNSSYFIYMYYQDIENLYDGDTYVGLIVECDSYEDFKEKKEYYEDLNYTVNSDAVNDDAIDDIVDYYHNVELGLIIVLSVIGVIAILVMNVYLFIQRRKELTLLLINGFGILDFIRLLSVEYLNEIKYVFPLSLILNVLIITLYQSSYLLLLLSCIDIILIYLITMLIYVILVKNIDIEKILRS
ncbi:MAG: ATP-binding cassette domain-containing protein [Erysipelotrichaceae bacterium]|nr:ATP-binding cassette domain-containing protein [Erysipelotrichaceae bacterium]